jgi:phosphohistidine phosphatase SixA
MLVGHLPNLGRLAALLLTDEPDRPLISFHQGELVALQRLDDGWFVTLALPPSAANPGLGTATPQ